MNITSPTSSRYAAYPASAAKPSALQGGKNLNFQGKGEPIPGERPSAGDTDQRWFLAYHFVQVLDALRRPAGQDRAYALEKLRTLVAGTADEILHARPQGASAELSLGEHALTQLAAYGTQEDIALCRKRGIRFDAVEIHSLGKPTVLMRAVSNGNAETARALLPHVPKEHLEYSNFYGQTVIDIALKRDDKRMFDLLRPAYDFFHFRKVVQMAKQALLNKTVLDELSDEDDESALLLCF